MPQFGGGYTDKKDFRRRFIESLTMALAVYPAAKVAVARGGIVLNRSSAPVKSKAPARRLETVDS